MNSFEKGGKILTIDEFIKNREKSEKAENELEKIFNDDDNNQGALFCKKQISKGLAVALYEYAKHLENEKSFDKNSYNCYYKSAADKGHVESMFIYATKLYNGDFDVQVDKKKAARYFKNAADRGHLKSMYNYAQMLKNGDGIEKNMTELCHYFKKAADNGDVDSMFNYGLMICNGCEVGTTKKTAAKYFKMAALKDHEGAKYHYDLLVDQGFVTEKKSKKLYPKSDRKSMKFYPKSDGNA